jgi:hypothetical protein
MVGFIGITIGGGFGAGADRTCGWTAFFVVCSADALRLSGKRSTVRALERGLVGGVTTPNPMSSSNSARLIASASAKLVARRRSGALS